LKKAVTRLQSFQTVVICDDTRQVYLSWGAKRRCKARDSVKKRLGPEEKLRLRVEETKGNVLYNLVSPNEESTERDSAGCAKPSRKLEEYNSTGEYN